VSFALIVIAVLEEKGLEALTRPTLVVDGIRACAAKVTDGLIGGFRDVNGSEVSCPMGTGELLIRSLPLVSPFRLPSAVYPGLAQGPVFGIAFVGFHAVARLAGQFGGGNDDAVMPKLDQAADKNKAAGAGVDGCYRPPGCTRCSLSRSARL